MKLRLEAHLPPRGPGRVAVVAMLVVGGAVALGLPLLVLLFVLSALRR